MMIETLARVAIAYPSGNTTAVVFDSLPNTNRKNVNEQIMQAWKREQPGQPEIEQCCCVLPPRNPAAIARVEMFGGEFCGNATRSAVWLATDGRDCAGRIEVSGVDRLLEFVVKDGVVSVEMPLPAAGKFITEVPEGTLVQLDGITQLVVAAPNQLRRQTPRQLLARLLATNAYGLAEQPAVGVSYYDQTSDKATFCVWVNEVKTMFDETACGSGTSAIGIALAWARQQPVTLSIVQPSGECITTTARYELGTITESQIAGNVRVLYDGSLSLT